MTLQLRQLLVAYVVAFAVALGCLFAGIALAYLLLVVCGEVL